MPLADGSQKATAIHIFSESARGTAEGFRQYDLRPNSTTTNATVAGSRCQRWQVPLGQIQGRRKESRRFPGYTDSQFFWGWRKERTNGRRQDRDGPGPRTCSPAQSPNTQRCSLISTALSPQRPAPSFACCSLRSCRLTARGDRSEYGRRYSDCGHASLFQYPDLFLLHARRSMTI